MAGVGWAGPDALRALAEDYARSAGERLRALPPLPQFSCTADHARLEVQRERAQLALGVLEALKREAASH